MNYNQERGEKTRKKRLLKMGWGDLCYLEVERFGLLFILFWGFFLVLFLFVFEIVSLCGSG